MININVVITYLKKIDEVLLDLRKGMTHASPYAVDALRSHAKELEEIKRTLLEGKLSSNKSLDKLLEKTRACIRDCIRPEYRGVSEALPMPKGQQWLPPKYEVTVPGVNLIFVVDVSASMFRSGGLEPGGRVRKLLAEVSREIEKRTIESNIPCTVSLVWYADPTDRDGHNRPMFWDIALNKDKEISKLTMKFDTVNRDQWKVGADNPESGMSAIYHTIQSVYDPEVENSLFLVSDEDQKLHGGNPGSHPRYQEVTFSQVNDRVNSLSIRNRFALFPTAGGRNGQNIPFFRSTKDYGSISDVSQLNDWIILALDPSSVIY